MTIRKAGLDTRDVAPGFVPGAGHLRARDEGLAAGGHIEFDHHEPHADISWMGVRFGLTRREAEVLGQIMLARSSKQIAYAMKISPATVDLHRARIRQKLGVHNTAGIFHILMIGQGDAL